MTRTARFIALAALCAIALLLLTAAGFTAPQAAAANYSRALCSQNAPLCTEVADSLNYNGTYTGHDEPSVLFYSNTAGSGNNNKYVLTLTKDPPSLPMQDGKGGTFNFQLHPAFWFGMA